MLLEWLGIGPEELSAVPIYVIFSLLLFALIWIMRGQQELQRSQIDMEESRDKGNRESLSQLHASIEAQRENIGETWNHVITGMTYQQLKSDELKVLMDGVGEDVKEVAELVQNERIFIGDFRDESVQGDKGIKEAIVDVMTSLKTLSAKIDEIYEKLCSVAGDCPKSGPNDNALASMSGQHDCEKR